MDVKQLSIDLVVVLLIPALVVGIYLGYFRSSTSEDVAETAALSEREKNVQMVKEALGILDRVKFAEYQKSVFASPVFTSLEDQTIPVVDEERGRDNPFIAPAGEPVTPIVLPVKKK